MAWRFRGTTEGPSDQGMIVEVRAYWEALRRGSLLPRREAIDPRGIAGALEHAFLIERIGPGLARFRIAGMAFHDLMDMDLRGIPLSCLFRGEARPQLQMELERAFHAPAILTLGLTSPADYARPELDARMILLPLADRAGTATLALGCIELGGRIGRAPRRFGLTSCHLERLPAPRESGAPSPVEAVPTMRVPAVGVPAVGVRVTAVPGRPHPAAPWLRLVKG